MGRIEKKSVALILFFLIMFSTNIQCFAASEDSDKNIGYKLSAGLMNVVTGWLELPLHMTDSMAQKNLGAVIEDGLIKGTFVALIRTAAGLVDVVTFFIPPYDKALMAPLYEF
ncbi:MAG: exosortase system-associated protein, TIGR04073 family [Candidatus Omnitrophica bacterium]|nr:exosortase system-associated protein, TIGR04073 family [Candidatus Omnitrophota bacterium]